MEYVYHSSNIQDLRIIEPRISTHGKLWVYAMKKPQDCLMFLGNHGDVINQTGFSDDLPFIAERFENALEYAYKNQKGSVYTLNGSDFQAGMTSFTEELVCGHPCKVMQEEKIDDALESILQLESAGKIKIYRYPHLPSWMPKDKSDLIEKLVRQVSAQGNSVLRSVEKFHPDILEKVKKRLPK